MGLSSRCIARAQVLFLAVSVVQVGHGPMACRAGGVNNPLFVLSFAVLWPVGLAKLLFSFLFFVLLFPAIFYHILPHSAISAEFCHILSHLQVLSYSVTPANFYHILPHLQYSCSICSPFFTAFFSLLLLLQPAFQLVRGTVKGLFI